VTGVTVSAKGRVFVNFPFWSDDHTISIAEVVDGKPKPFPNDAWNAKDGPPAERWICVQSVVVDDQDALWVLDPASPKTEAVVKGGPKLVKIDLATNKVSQTITFDENVAPERSYLNDVRLDTKTGHAFITESGTGAIIVVDLKNGKARRLLANDPSTKLEPEAEIIVDGMKTIDPKTGNAPAFQADGIALDKENGWLYYHALTGKTMYRIKTENLLDESLTPVQLGAKVENLGPTPKPDGMLEGSNGIVFLTAIEENAIVRFDPQSRNTTMVIQDKHLQWPDTMAWGPNGQLYVTTSQIHRMPKYHGGVSKQQGPYMVYRVKLP
jgi:sugar lactone lactonase YvrE